MVVLGTLLAKLEVQLHTTEVEVVVHLKMWAIRPLAVLVATMGALEETEQTTFGFLI